MSQVTTLSQCIDAYIDQTNDGQNFADTNRLYLSSTASHQKRALLFFGSMPRPDRAGLYVVSAHLLLCASGAVGAQTTTVKAIKQTWKERSVSWQNQPTVTATDDVALVLGALVDKQQVDFDVTAMVRTALLGTGSLFYGFELSTSIGGPIAFRSSESPIPELRPQLVIELTKFPTVVADLVPGDGSYVSVSKPVVRFNYFDRDGEDQGALQVQIDAANDFTSADFDSGTVTTADPELDLSTTAYAGLSDGGSTYWRARAQDAEGNWSAWSDPVQIHRAAKGTFVINAPSTVVEETTPSIITTLSKAQRAIAYILEQWQPDTSSWLTVWTKPFFAAPSGAGVAYHGRVPIETTIGRDGGSLKTSPIAVRDLDYRLTVRSWDTQALRVSTPGDPVYQESQVVLQWHGPVSAPMSPDNLAVDANPEPGIEGDRGPGVLVSWHRDAVPDSWALLVDGVVKDDHVPATDWQGGP